jgi:prevent-host-death family protein
MDAVNMHEAKSRLSALVEAVESGREAEVVIARNGKPAARLVPLAKPDVSKRIGVAAGLYTAPSDETWAEMDEEVERMFLDAADGEHTAE